MNVRGCNDDQREFETEYLMRVRNLGVLVLC